MKYLSHGDVHGTRLVPRSTQCLQGLCKADLPHNIVVIDVAVAQGPAVVACEEDFVCARVPNRRLVRESKARVRRDRADARVRPKNRQESRIEYLKDGRRGGSRVEDLIEGAVAKAAVVTLNRER